MSWKNVDWLRNGYWVSLTREQFEEWVNLDYAPAVQMIGGIVDFTFIYNDEVYSIEEMTPRKQKNVTRQIEITKWKDGDFKPIYIGENYDEVLNHPCFDEKSFNEVFEQLLFLN